MLQRRGDLDDLQRIGSGVGALTIALVLASLGGAAAGALLASSARPAGAVGGFVGGLLSIVTLAVYASFRSSLWNYEIALVQCVGLAPGFAVFWLLKRFFARPA